MQKGALRPNADQRAINRGFAARGQVRATNVPYRARANRSRRSNEPMMAGPQRRPYQPFAIVIVEVERGRRGFLRGAVASTLRSHLLRGRP